VIAALVVAVAAGVVGSTALGATPKKKKPVPTTIVKVVEQEYSFTLSKSVAPAGWVVFKATNKGTIAHDFFIYGINKGTVAINPGQSTTLKVLLKKGSYHYVCTIGEHAIRGMQGQFTVK
jgi:plastocyanin